jgi:trimeric autotransporter adhesin
VPGGSSNNAQGDFSLAAGRDAQANHQGAFVWADSNAFMFPSTAQDQFSVRSTGGARLVSGIDGSGNPSSGVEMPTGTSGWSTLVNGQPFDIRVNNSRGLRIEPASDGSNQSPNVIGGTGDNTVTPGVHSATIAGGGRWDPPDPATANRVTDDQGTVGGGAGNRAGDGAGTTDDRGAATVSGGFFNTASGQASTVGGGRQDVADGRFATVAGGDHNNASGNNATVGGGGMNNATGLVATVAGGFDNTASGQEAIVAGGSNNIAQGRFSFAAGLQAHADHNGAFVWADEQPIPTPAFSSTAANQFSVRATGGVRFVSAVDPTTGAPTNGVQLAPNSGSWGSLSDRASKRAIEPISGRRVLRKLASVPVSTWSYRAQDRSIRHIGPMAQNFYRAFGVGEDRRHIDSVDADGVALAAIKGLARELRAERRRRHQEERRMARLEARVAALEREGGR